MGTLDCRVEDLERLLAETANPGEPAPQLGAILRELATLKASCAPGLRGGVPVEPEQIPRRILGPSYTHSELLRLATARASEAGAPSTSRALCPGSIFLLSSGLAYWISYRVLYIHSPSSA